MFDFLFYLLSMLYMVLFKCMKLNEEINNRRVNGKEFIEQHTFFAFS